MRPYLAIIRDSFHEALASRVLWILLAITTVILLLLVPFGIIEQAGSHLSREDFLDRAKLMRKIAAAGKSQEPSPGRRVWELLDESTQRNLQQTSGQSTPAAVRFRPLGDALQQMITRRDFYRAEDWAKVPLPKAARELEKQGLDKLPADQLARFNRLALDAAFPEEIAPIPARQVQLAYFHWEFGMTLPVEREQLYPALNQMIVAVLAIVLGVVGVFVAVMVTASMIPQTFEAGSIDLLLSKPISRSGLFLAKFVGGCAFIAINAAYLIGGLWLILGVRFGLWNERLLLAIPLYLFLFAIYHGVSSLAGVVWRNAIVSVVMAVLFWLVCFIVGTASGLVEQYSLNLRRVVTIVPAGEDLIVVNSQGEVQRWDTGDQDWQPIFVGRSERMPFGFGRQLVGPIYDPEAERILAANLGVPGFGPLGGSTRLLVGKRDDDWQREEGVNVPDGTRELLRGKDGQLLAASPQGVFRLEGDLAARQEDINVFGLHIPLPERGGRFVSVGPEVALRPLEAAAIDAQTGAVALFDGYRLVVLAPDSMGKHRKSSEAGFDSKLPGKVALADNAVFLALDGEVRRYDLALKLQETLTPTTTGVPISATASPDGHVVAIVDRNGTLWLYDVAVRKPLELSLTGQGDISAVAFAREKMYVADRLTRVTTYDLQEDKVEGQHRGAMTLGEGIYRYALHPFYAVFPKPGELNQTVMYLLASQDNKPGAIRLDDGPPNAAPQQQRLNVWGPIWSNSAFLAVVLALACVYVARKDF